MGGNPKHSRGDKISVDRPKPRLRDDLRIRLCPHGAEFLRKEEQSDSPAPHLERCADERKDDRRTFRQKKKESHVQLTSSLSVLSCQKATKLNTMKMLNSSQNFRTTGEFELFALPPRGMNRYLRQEERREETSSREEDGPFSGRFTFGLTLTHLSNHLLKDRCHCRQNCTTL